jgi:hypothetical protein
MAAVSFILVVVSRPARCPLYVSADISHIDGSKPYPVVILLPSEPFGYRLAACAGEKVAGSTFHLSAAVAIKIERAARRPGGAA